MVLDNVPERFPYTVNYFQARSTAGLHPAYLGVLEGRPEKALRFPAARLLKKGCASLVALLSEMTIVDRAASTAV